MKSAARAFDAVDAVAHAWTRRLTRRRDARERSRRRGGWRRRGRWFESSASLGVETRPKGRRGNRFRRRRRRRRDATRWGKGNASFDERREGPERLRVFIRIQYWYAAPPRAARERPAEAPLVNTPRRAAPLVSPSRRPPSRRCRHSSRVTRVAAPCTRDRTSARASGSPSRDSRQVHRWRMRRRRRRRRRARASPRVARDPCESTGGGGARCAVPSRREGTPRRPRRSPAFEAVSADPRRRVRELVHPVAFARVQHSVRCVSARATCLAACSSSRVDHAPELVKFAELFAPVRVDAHASSRARAPTRPRRALATCTAKRGERFTDHSVKPAATSLANAPCIVNASDGVAHPPTPTPGTYASDSTPSTRARSGGGDDEEAKRQRGERRDEGERRDDEAGCLRASCRCSLRCRRRRRARRCRATRTREDSRPRRVGSRRRRRGVASPVVAPRRRRTLSSSSSGGSGSSARWVLGRLRPRGTRRGFDGGGGDGCEGTNAVGLGGGGSSRGRVPARLGHRVPEVLFLRVTRAGQLRAKETVAEAPSRVAAVVGVVARGGGEGVVAALVRVAVQVGVGAREGVRGGARENPRACAAATRRGVALAVREGGPRRRRRVSPRGRGPSPSDPRVLSARRRYTRAACGGGRDPPYPRTPES